MTRLTTLSMLATLTLAAFPVTAMANEGANGDVISVSALREQVIGHSPKGAPLVVHTVLVSVGVRDIDIASGSGWDQLNRRVRKASRMACDALDEAAPYGSSSEAAHCDRRAARTAMRAARDSRDRLAVAGALTFRLAAN